MPESSSESLTQDEALHDAQKCYLTGYQRAAIAAIGSLTKSKSQRKLRSAKENAPPQDLKSLMPGYRSSPVKLKSPLPPHPPSANPLKQKLIAEVAAKNGVAGISDSGVKVIVRMKPPSKCEEEEMIVKQISSDALTINEHTFTFEEEMIVKKISRVSFVFYFL